MKISMDPMARLREDAAAKINQHFGALVLQSIHRDQAHGRKRDVANAVKGGLQLSEHHPFAQEAKLRCTDVASFAETILQKGASGSSDLIELERQRNLLAVDSATSVDAVMAVLAGIGLTNAGATDR